MSQNEKQFIIMDMTKESFRRIAHMISELMGSPAAFLIALSTVLAWLFSGPQLAINTATTVITFLMVFLIQNSHDKLSKKIGLRQK